MEELNANAEELMAERKTIEDQDFKEWEKYPRCALLPSPEKLNTSVNSRGSDVTDTLEDFKRIIKWVKDKKLLNQGFYDLYREEDEQLEKDSFGNAVKLAFSTAFDPMRNTSSTELEELVFWYYAGHGLGKETAKTLEYSSTPYLSKVDLSPDYAIVFDFVKEERKVKGGELFLHMGGFCDLYGLLKPWIAAVKSESVNAPGQKKNKHLVVILDSCHSGIIAQELKEFEKQVRKKDESFLKENSVTIQAACGPNERTFGGYFTPLFLYLNDPQNNERLEQLRKKWKQMTDGKKDEYRSIELPSPMVVTKGTLPQGTEEEAPPLAAQGDTVDPQPPPAQGDTVDLQPQNVAMEINVQNFKLTLFPDAGFFKFCSLNVFQHLQAKALESLAEKERALNPASLDAFMKSKSFEVLDYRLKTYKGAGPADKHAGTLMGLFLLDDPVNPGGFAVCAHLHFENVGKVQRINLVHHKIPPGGRFEYVEDGRKFPVDMKKAADGARKLVEACRQFVEDDKLGRWSDVSEWNMTGSANGNFRSIERSDWEKKYLESIKQYELPKVPANKQ